MKKKGILQFIDIVMLTIIFFGIPIYTSLIATFGPQVVAESVSEASGQISDVQNYYMLFMQALSLVVALIYLWFRKFDFRQLALRFNVRALVLGVFFFLLAGLAMDVWNVLFYGISFFASRGLAPGAIFVGTSFSTIIYSLFNGLYEELYFLGFSINVPKKNQSMIVLPVKLTLNKKHVYTAQDLYNLSTSGYVRYYTNERILLFYPLFLLL